MILKDGSFEITPSGWTLSQFGCNPGALIATYAGEPEWAGPPKRGSRFLHLEGLDQVGGPGGSWFAKAAQTIGLETPMRVGVPHQSVYYVRGNTLVPQNNLILTLGQQETQSLADWTRREFSFIPSAPTQAIEIKLNQGNHQSASFWDIDDFRVREAQSRLRQCMDYVVARLGECSMIKATGLGIAQNWMTEPASIASYCYVAGESRTPLPTRSIESLATLGCYTIVNTGDPQGDLLKTYREIIEAVNEEPSMGGAAIDSWVSDLVPLKTAGVISGNFQIADIMITVRYRNERNEG